jgi:hypothetical protein
MILAVALVLGGCDPVGQRTFVANADKPPRPPVLPASLTRPQSTALVVIAFPAAQDWHDTLGVAVGLARARKPNVLFTVESAVARAGSPAAQADALARAASDANDVARAIVADGVDRSQVELTAVTDPGAAQEEIRIYVR